MRRAWAALARLGGVLVRPRATLSRILDAEGSIFEVVPWMVIVALTVAPIPAGQALLTARVDLATGLTALLGVITQRMSGPMIGALAAAAVLAWLGRARGVTFDRALDTCGYLLVPYLLLSASGAALSALGLELWFLPHRLLRGNALALAVRFVVAYGWSLLLFARLCADVLARPKESDGARATT